MNIYPQILQQVQDSVVPSPILVIPIKPTISDTNTAIQEKTSQQTKKDSQNIKPPIAKTVNEKLPKTPSVTTNKSEVKIDSIALKANNDSLITHSFDSVNKSIDENNITDSANNLQTHISYRTSLFTGHELKPTNIEAIERPNTKYDWMLGIFILITFILLLNKILNPKKWAQQLQILFSKRAFEQQLRDEKDFRSPFLYTQFIASSLTIALFIMQWFNFQTLFINKEFEFYSFLKILIALVGLLLLYFISQKIAGFIVNKGKLVSEYLLSTLLLFNLAGFIMFPVCIGLAYAHAIPSSILINSGMFIMGFLFFIKLYKGLTIASSYNSLHLFYLFLYICTLEILPLGIAVKFFNENW